jgi:hypothetical protein
VKLLLVQLLLQAVFEFGANLGDFHPGAYQEFAAQQFVGLVVVDQFARDAAILAILIPAETSVGNGFRADVLEAAQDRILFGNFERLPENLDGDEPLVWAKYLIGTARTDSFLHLRIDRL